MAFRIPTRTEGMGFTGKVVIMQWQNNSESWDGGV